MFMMYFYFPCATLYNKDMLFNSVSISLHTKTNFHFIFCVIYYSNLIGSPYPFFYLPHFLFLLFCKY